MISGFSVNLFISDLRYVVNKFKIGKSKINKKKLIKKVRSITERSKNLLEYGLMFKINKSLLESQQKKELIEVVAVDVKRGFFAKAVSEVMKKINFSKDKDLKPINTFPALTENNLKDDLWKEIINASFLKDPSEISDPRLKDDFNKLLQDPDAEVSHKKAAEAVKQIFEKMALKNIIQKNLDDLNINIKDYYKNASGLSDRIQAANAFIQNNSEVVKKANIALLEKG